MAVVTDRRIEIVIGGKKVPAVTSNPTLSSAGTGWRGFLLEGHSSDTPLLVEAPEHFSSKHILRLNTGISSATEWRIEGRRRNTTDHPGSVSIIPAKTTLSAVIKKTSCLVLEIDPVHLQQVFGDSAAGGRIELAPKLTIPDRQIQLLMTAMQADVEAGSPAGRLYGDSLGNSLGTYLTKRFSVFDPKLEIYKGGLPRPRLNRVLGFVDQHLNESISLTAMAETAGLSMYHFAKAFKESTGMTPHHFVLQRRIDRAKQLLRDPKRSVLEASVRTGFVDQSHFTKIFHRLVGVTPTEYRSQI